MMAGTVESSEGDFARVHGENEMRSSEEDDLLSRSTKKVKGSDADFSGDCTGLRSYEDLEQLQEVEIPRSISYREALIGEDEMQESDDDDVDDEEVSSEEESSDEEREPVDGESDEFASKGYKVIEHLRGKHSVPEFVFSKKVESRICIPFKYALVVKLLGRMISLKALETRLKDMWGRRGELTVTDIPNEYFVVVFDSKVDFEYALEGGPWMIYDHYLMVRSWCEDFNPWTDSVEKVMVWVRFPELPIQYYDEFVLMALGNRVGKAIRVDMTTSNLSRCKFARLWVI